MDYGISQSRSDGPGTGTHTHLQWVKQSARPGRTAWAQMYTLATGKNNQKDQARQFQAQGHTGHFRQSNSTRPYQALEGAHRCDQQDQAFVWVCMKVQARSSVEKSKAAVRRQ